MRRVQPVLLFLTAALFSITCVPANALMLFKTGTAPEIDPSLAVGAVALLAGSIAVLRSRKT